MTLSNTTLALLLLSSANALVVPNQLSAQRRSLGSSVYASRRDRNTLKMDVETPNTRDTTLLRQWKVTPFLTRQLLPQKQKVSIQFTQDKKEDSSQKRAPPPMQQPQSMGTIPDKLLHGMPWKTSIDPSYTPNAAPYYMNFWEHQIQFMKENLTNLKVLPVVSSSTGDDLSYRETGADAQPMRMHTLQFCSEEFRLIRMTVMDAGTRTQVFTSVWYPQPEYNTPVLGVDALQFGGRKHLCIMDFQPIDANDDDDPCEYEHLMAPIRDDYPSLHEKMSPRFYDENSFFSSQMLLGRQDDPEQAERMVKEDFFPAFQRYLQTYVDLHKDTTPRPDQASRNLKRHQAYDVYSAERDPAHALLSKCFGQDFADDYVFNILFPFSRTEPKMPKGVV